VSQPGLRPVTRADAAVVNDPLAAAEAVDQAGEHYDLDDVLENLENSMTDPSPDRVLAELDGEVVAHSGWWRALPPRGPSASPSAEPSIPPTDAEGSGRC
jgi:hypothetical protein